MQKNMCALALAMLAVVLLALTGVGCGGEEPAPQAPQAAPGVPATEAPAEANAAAEDVELPEVTPEMIQALPKGTVTFDATSRESIDASVEAMRNELDEKNQHTLDAQLEIYQNSLTKKFGNRLYEPEKQVQLLLQELKAFDGMTVGEFVPALVTATEENLNAPVVPEQPEATDEAAPEATEEAAPEATDEAAPEATEEAAPEATEEAAPEATDEAAPEATEEAAPEATDEAAPEATEKAAPQE